MIWIFVMSKRSKKSSKTRPRSPSDLNDKKWKVIQALIPEQKGLGRPREVNMRRVLDALLYIVREDVRGGCCPKNTFRRGKQFMVTFANGAKTE